ncbi:hypothetical protein COR50_06650 [Chitinophaga caeni]|uniref:Thioredoxin domain-containing protein n=1 Tax=Chitinophaga caeni TaxID=2029983 RepID=A0A291QSF6_9BACT|nr:hypothetical protein [Chitinophaga caeni]ATL46886.1 hypothetical protein COR50_06650 [Chitinophaga caeni]
MWIKSILLGGCLLLSTFAFAQNGAMKGKIDTKTIINDANHAWFYAGVNKYQPNATMVNYIKTNNDKFKILVVTGLEDEKSKALLPAFYKTMIMASYPEENISIYAADNKMQTGDDKVQSYKIKKLPTFILLKGEKEVGRINGDIHQSMEGDLAAMMLKAIKKEKGDE